MANSKTHKGKQKPTSQTIHILIIIALFAGIALLYLTSSSSLLSSSFSHTTLFLQHKHKDDQKYLYWGNRIDCPGKHCDTCAGLGHQESSLRCALEEAMFLQRTFVMPSRMCLSSIHNKVGILSQSNNERWAASSCAMDSLYDINLISNTVPVILDNSKIWYKVLSTSMKLGSRGIAHVQGGVTRFDLQNYSYSNLLLINRTANPLAWFAECKDRHKQSSTILPYSFLPSMATKKLRDLANKIKGLLGDYDAMHVRRGDILNLRKDRFGVARSLHPHLDRDTRPEFILCRISKWVPQGRTLFIASNEGKPGFFSPLGKKYKLVYSSNYSHILDGVIENNYQLFMLERLILMGAKVMIKTYKEYENDVYYLTDDPKKASNNWQIPVYTMDSKEEC